MDDAGRAGHGCTVTVMESNGCGTRLSIVIVLTGGDVAPFQGMEALSFGLIEQVLSEGIADMRGVFE